MDTLMCCVSVVIHWYLAFGFIDIWLKRKDDGNSIFCFGLLIFETVVLYLWSFAWEFWAWFRSLLDVIVFWVCSDRLTCFYENCENSLSVMWYDANVFHCVMQCQSIPIHFLFLCLLYFFLVFYISSGADDKILSIE